MIEKVSKSHGCYITEQNLTEYHLINWLRTLQSVNIIKEWCIFRYSVYFQMFISTFEIRKVENHFKNILFKKEEELLTFKEYIINKIIITKAGICKTLCPNCLTLTLLDSHCLPMRLPTVQIYEISLLLY